MPRPNVPYPEERPGGTRLEGRTLPVQLPIHAELGEGSSKAQTLTRPRALLSDTLSRGAGEG
jgi:hypothetical protein